MTKVFLNKQKKKKNICVINLIGSINLHDCVNTNKKNTMTINKLIKRLEMIKEVKKKNKLSLSRLVY
jgi:hypothetical protein